MDRLAVFSRLRAGFFGVLVAAVVMTAACSNSPIALTPAGSSTAMPAARLPAAIATGCIASSNAGQTVALPSAGGVTGTVTVGPAASPASNCAISMEIATGSDATLLLSKSTQSRRFGRRRADAPASTLPSPIAQVDLSTTTTSTSWLAVSFTMPSSVPPGNYPATVSATVDLGDGQTYTVVSNYTLTVSSNGTAALSGINVTLGNYSAGLLTIYPVGTTLPTPAPTPTPIASASVSSSTSPSVSPTGTTAPTATPTPAITPTPKPVPTPTPTAVADCLSENTVALAECGSYVTSGYYDGPAGYYSPEPTAGASSPQPLYNMNQQGNMEGSVYAPYYWFVGTITISLPNYSPAYMQRFVNDCPSTVSVAQSGANGDTYAVTFPGNGAQYALGPNGSSCEIYVESAEEDEPSYVLTLGYGGGAIEPTLRR